MKKTLVRHKFTGDLGEVLMVDGEKRVRLDRPGVSTTYAYDVHTWEDEPERELLSRLQIARIAYEADRALCLAVGDHKGARLEWRAMHDDARVKFMKDGPPAADRRLALYKHILKFFKE